MHKVFFAFFFIVFFSMTQVFALTVTTATKGEVTTAKESQSKEDASSEEVSSKSGIEVTLNSFYLSTKEKIETFRKKQAEYFGTKRDELKLKIGIKSNSDLLKEISPTVTPAPVSDAGPQTIGELEVKKMDNPVDYGRLILFSALASLFASALMFYVVLVFVTFMLIRTVFRMFI